MKEVLDALRDSFDFILIDAPPAIVVTDPMVLSVLCDGVILVLNGKTTKVATARKAAEQLATVRAPVLGVVLNGIDSRNPDYASYYNQYYSLYCTTEGKETAA